MTTITVVIVERAIVVVQSKSGNNSLRQCEAYVTDPGPQVYHPGSDECLALKTVEREAKAFATRVLALESASGTFVPIVVRHLSPIRYRHGRF